MLNVTSKVDEQATERIIGWFLAYSVGSQCSVAGDYWRQLVTAAPAWQPPPNERPFRKHFLNRSAS